MKADYHLQLLAQRFNDLADDYLREVQWIAAPVVEAAGALQRTMDALGDKQRFQSMRTLVFDEVRFGKEILHFFRPVVCCKRVLLSTESLILHLLGQNHADDDDGLDQAAKRRAIMFNMYLQMMKGVLERYDNNYELIDQFTVDYLKKGRDYLSCILRKPISPRAERTFISASFRKWKYVFDYDCGHCGFLSDDGDIEVEYNGAIAWFKIFANSLAVNPIRHLEGKQHAQAVRELRPDYVIPTVQDINNNPNWSNPDAVAYLTHARQAELGKQAAAGLRLVKETPYDKIFAYLGTELDSALGGLAIEPFGSRVMGTASRESDVDLHIKSCSGFEGEACYKLTLAWAKRIQKTGELKIARTIPQGPLLVSVDVKPLNLTLDLTFGSDYVVANAKLVGYFFDEQPYARLMYHLLVEWKNKTDLSSNFHSHLLIMLLVFYMQTQKYLPPVRSLLIGPQKLDNGTYNANFAKRFSAELFPGHLPMLARGFFGYWAEFDWAENGICAFDAQVKPKKSLRFVPNRQLPMMCSDYFDQSRNVASNVNRDDYEKFVIACKEAREVVKKNVNFT